MTAGSREGGHWKAVAALAAALVLCLATGQAAAQAAAPLISGQSGGWRQVSCSEKSTGCLGAYGQPA